MTSRERMLAALACKPVDYAPCSFMLFSNMYYHTRSVTELIERQVALGLDAYAHVGHLESALHPDAKCAEWVEKRGGQLVFHRRIDTPKGPLTARYLQRENWPRADYFPLFNDWLVTRSEEVLVKPEEDLEKLPYIFGPFKDEAIQKLKATSREARAAAEKHQLILVGGWKGSMTPGPVESGEPIHYSDAGVMGCDAMAWLSGYEEIMVLALTRPDIIREYARIIHEWNMKQIEIYLEVANPDMIWRRGWYETTEFWTPGTYRSIIAPFLAREVALAHQAGKKFGYIMTSAFLPLLDDILASDIDVLIGLDPKQGKGTEFKTVKQTFSKKQKALWGGVSGAITVEQETPAETEQAVIEALQILGQDGGFVLSPVDNVREDTERAWHNTNVFIETWKRHRIPG